MSKLDWSGWKVVGHVPVDTGQLMITDPCYLRDWEDNDFVSIRIYEKSDDPSVTLQWTVDFIGHDQVIKPYDKTMNNLIAEGTFVLREDTRPIRSFSYDSACRRTIRNGAGQVTDLAVATETGWGDGCYPVYANVKDGRVMQLRIDFN